MRRLKRAGAKVTKKRTKNNGGVLEGFVTTHRRYHAKSLVADNNNYTLDDFRFAGKTIPVTTGVKPDRNNCLSVARSAGEPVPAFIVGKWGGDEKPSAMAHWVVIQEDGSIVDPIMLDMQGGSEVLYFIPKGDVVELIA